MRLAELKYNPKTWATLVFVVLISIAALLFYGRTKEFLRPDMLLGIAPDLYQHISNFSISYLVYSGVGFMWLLMGVSFRYITAIGAALLVANVVCELWIPTLNTPDTIDAYYGITGTLLAFIFLLITKQFGLKPNTSATTKQPGSIS